MEKELKGLNALTVFIAPARKKRVTKMFFCPYRQNITGSYQGEVKRIYPGYDPDESPQFLVHPQRQSYGDNINYIFVPTNPSNDSTIFWIQDQYFNDDPIRTYFCFNCQNPQLYFDSNKAIHYQNKTELKVNETYGCDHCHIPLTYMGIVKITQPDNAII